MTILRKEQLKLKKSTGNVDIDITTSQCYYFSNIFKSTKSRSISLFILLITRQMFAHCFSVRSSFSVVKSGFCFSIISTQPF